jgi:hypothetical protein
MNLKRKALAEVKYKHVSHARVHLITVIAQCSLVELVMQQPRPRLVVGYEVPLSGDTGALEHRNKKQTPSV